MNSRAKEILEKYKQIIRDKVNPKSILTDDDGRIELNGTRWIFMDVRAFPGYMVKVTKQIVGKMAPQFIYWFGYAYGEDVAGRYLSLGVPKDQIATIIFAFTAVVAGWGIAEVEEFSIEKKYLRIRVWNDFETESDKVNGEDDAMSFLRGVATGLFGRILSTKTQSTYKIENDSFVMEVTPR